MDSLTQFPNKTTQLLLGRVFRRFRVLLETLSAGQVAPGPAKTSVEVRGRRPGVAIESLGAFFEDRAAISRLPSMPK